VKRAATKNPKCYDKKLLHWSIDPKKSSGSKFRDYFSFLGKSKEQLEKEKEQRLLMLRSKTQDVEGIIKSSLQQNLAKHGKTALIGRRGQTT
jgi:hypothetical protein